MMVISTLFLLYLITIAAFVYGYDKVEEFVPKKVDPHTHFTVVIPFRNEANNLPTLLESILDLKYPSALVEYIWVDDNSSDNSANIIKAFATKNSNITCLLTNNQRISQSPKKDAISTAINLSSKEWIITTDADCLVPENWLSTLDNFIQLHPCNMVVAPVSYLANTSLFHQFQVLDFSSLQAATVGGFGLGNPFLCNGANLCYKKEAFLDVHGFDNNNFIASGDDIFLMEKFIRRAKKSVRYLKSVDAIVQTLPINGVQNLIHQRVRWASKTTNYTLGFGKLIGALVLIGNGSMVCLPILWYFNIISGFMACAIVLLKLLFDYQLLQRISSFYQQKIHLATYIWSSLLYPFFNVVVFLIAISSSYKWKGRTFSK